MSQGFMKQINSLVYASDLMIEVLDARFPERTRNINIENRILEKEKALLIVLNKADLADKTELEKEKKRLIKETKARVVFVSSKEKNGGRVLKTEIAKVKGKRTELNNGLIGYTQAGKSTLINALSGKGKGKVKTSSKAGYTRGLQKIKISEGVYLIDAPGIIPYNVRDEFELFIVGAKNANQLKDIESAALRLITELAEKIKKEFKVKSTEDMEILEEIALSKRFLASGGKADTQKAARFLLEKYDKNEL